jgi:hypothetical protein
MTRAHGYRSERMSNMTWRSSWLSKSWLPTAFTAEPSPGIARRRRSRSARLRIEQLEDRCVPTTFSPTIFTDGGSGSDGQGGGVYGSGSSVTLTNVTVASNTATGGTGGAGGNGGAFLTGVGGNGGNGGNGGAAAGGGLFVNSGTVDVTNITVADTFSCGHSDSGQFWLAPFGAGATMDSP